MLLGRLSGRLLHWIGPPAGWAQPTLHRLRKLPARPTAGVPRHHALPALRSVAGIAWHPRLAPKQYCGVTAQRVRLRQLREVQMIHGVMGWGWECRSAGGLFRWSHGLRACECGNPGLTGTAGAGNRRRSKVRTHSAHGRTHQCHEGGSSRSAPWRRLACADAPCVHPIASRRGFPSWARGVDVA